MVCQLMNQVYGVLKVVLRIRDLITSLGHHLTILDCDVLENMILIYRSTLYNLN